MPYNTFMQIFDLMSWRAIVAIGLTTNYITYDEESLVRGIYTIVFMVIGTILSFVVKKFLKKYYDKD